MPTFEAICQKCASEYEYAATIADRNKVPCCKICKGEGVRDIRSCPTVKPDLNDWSSENSGRGRFNKQLMTHCVDRNDAIDKAKAKGWEVLDKN